MGADGGHGGAGAESHVGSVSKKVVKLTETQPENIKTVNAINKVASLYSCVLRMMKMLCEKFYVFLW